MLQENDPVNRIEIVEGLSTAFEVNRRECEQTYYKFVHESWKVLEPETPLIWNWHIKYLCNVIQNLVEKVANKEDIAKDVVINMPPRSLKSYICSIMLIPWVWTKWPHLKFINSSYALGLSTSHCRKSRLLIESDWYQEKWGEMFSLVGDQNVKSYFENDYGGHKFAASVTGAVTGHGADIVIVDDILNPLEAASPIALERSLDHYHNTLYSRLNDQSKGLRIVVMQRLHENDLTGNLINTEPEKHLHIVLPAELDEKLVKPSGLAQFYKDGLFFPDRFTPLLLESLKSKGRSLYASQYQQSPVPQEGNILKTEWWRYYKVLPTKLDEVIMSWDMAFKNKKESDFVVALIMGRVGSNVYLINRYRGKWAFYETLEMFRKICANYPEARRKLVEDTANGPAIISALSREITGIIPIPVKDSKEARAEAIAPAVESGNVYLPEPDQHTWVYEFIDECAMFPKGKHDDQVDAFTQAMDYFAGKNNPLAQWMALTKM